MKQVLALFVLVFALQAVATEKPMKLSKAKCLEDGADALLNWLSEGDPTADYHIVRDDKGYPVELIEIESNSRMDLYGVWRVGPNQEFVQYGDGSGVAMVTMEYNPKTKACTALKFDVGQDDGDGE